MKLTRQIINHAEGLKAQNFESLACFVKYALEANGRDYATIRQHMITVTKFAMLAKKHGITAGASKIKEIYQDFFVDNRRVDKTTSEPNKHQHVVTYEKFGKGGVVKCSVSIQKSTGEFGSVICFYEDNGKKEILTTIHFANDNLFFQTETNGNPSCSRKNLTPICEECRMDFSFNQKHHLTKVDYLHMYSEDGRNYIDSKVISLSHTQTQTPNQTTQAETGMTK